MRVLKKLLFESKSRSVQILLLLMVIEVIFFIDLVVPTSLVGFYILAVVMASLYFSSGAGLAVAVLCTLLGIFGDELVQTPADVAVRYFVIFLVFLFGWWASNFLREQFEILEKINKDLVETSERLFKLKEEVLKAVSIALEYKDPYTQGHSKRVAMYSRMIAEEMGCDRDEINYIVTAALLHDIGKICVDEKILQKPSKLSPSERRNVEKHVIAGASILERVPSLRHFIPAVKHHHERWDGQGYPSGLKGNSIPLAARIIAVADSFEAMTSDRAYRSKMSKREAVREIVSCAGTQFDPQVVEAFLSIMEEHGITPKRAVPVFRAASVHAIVFYDRTEHTLQREAVDVISDSTLANKKVLACFDDIARSVLRNRFRNEVRSGQLELVPASSYDWYGSDFPRSMEENLNGMLEEAQNCGYEGLVIIGDGDYIGKELGFRNLLVAETYINEAMRDKPVTLICMYSSQVKEDPRVEELIQSHTHILQGNNCIRVQEYKKKSLPV